MSARDAYTAIADPTRRQILELLRDDGEQTAGAIAARFKNVSRPGISRHLRVLRESGVVVSIRRGKHQHYQLDSAPLLAIQQGWLSSFADMQTASLRALRAQVESSSPSDREPSC